MLSRHCLNTMLLWKYMLFYKQRIFSTQPQCCLTFLRIEPQMLLKCCLLHIDMILPRHVIFCLFVSISNSMSFNHFQPGGIDLLPLHLFFSKTKNNINLKLCMVVIFYINFQKIILLCHASSWFDNVIIPVLWVMVFFAFSTFSKNVKCFHFKSVLNNPKLFKKQWKQLFIIYNHKTFL